MASLDAPAITCYTAPGVKFTSRADLQQHYKSDWHRYNLKRKVAGLPPVTADEFEARRAAALAMRAESHAAKGSKQDHVKDKNKQRVAERNEKKARAMSEASSMTGGETQDPRDHDARPPMEGMVGDSHVGVESNDEVEEEEEEIEIDLTQSLFDHHQSPDIETALNYMHKFGFIVPDFEYVSDLEGLLSYLHEKIRIGKMCLYCQRMFRTAQSCRQHMIDKSHCKIKYEDQEDVDEFADFYDFSSSYTMAAARGASIQNSASRSSSAGETMDEGDDYSDEDVEIDPENDAAIPKIEVLPSGELLLTRHGKTKRLGVRWLRRYYKQNVRVIDDRASVVAARRERLLQMYQQAGIPTTADVVRQQVADGALAMGGHRAGVSSTLARFANQPKYVGAELLAARQHFRAIHNKRMKTGINQNLLMKNKLAGKNRGEGVGVHG